MTSSFWYSELFFSIFYFYTLTSLIICFNVICSASAAHAVLFLVVLFILVSFIFILLGAEYLGLVYIIVYVGAIAVLFLFIIMLLDLRNLVYQRFTMIQALSFSWTIMLVSDLVIYLLDYSQLPFFSLPLVPVSSLIDLNGDTVALSDNLQYLSPELFNIYNLYVVGAGFLLAFVMVGVVLMLGQTITVSGTRYRLRNKLTVRSGQTVLVGRARNGL